MKKQVSSNKLKSKGDRLGWSPLKNETKVSLRKVLSKGEVVKKRKNDTHLLVP